MAVRLAELVELDPQVVLYGEVALLAVVPDLLEEGGQEPGHRHVVGVFVVGQLQGAEEVRGPLHERPLEDDALLLGTLAAANLARTTG